MGDEMGERGIWRGFLSAAAIFCAWGYFVASAHAETDLERGAYLVRGIGGCGNCHTPKGTDGRPIENMELAGGFVVDIPHVFTAVTANITPDKETGIGTWTDAQIAAAIREGKRPDGTIIGPPMPIELYRNISDRDVRAIIAYLRAVPAVKHKVGKSVYHIPLPLAYGPPVTHVAEVPRTDKIAYGGYLAGPVGHCVECHTPMLKNGRVDFEHRLGAGGRELPGPNGSIVVSRNLTPNPTKGLGRWTDRQIKTAITKGIRPDGSTLAPLMAFAWYANINDSDLDAIIAYLRSLKSQP